MMSPTIFITHKGGGGVVHKLLTLQLAHFFSFKVSSSLLLIEVKHCCSFKGAKLFDPFPGLLPHPVINEWSNKGNRIIRYIQPSAPLIVCGVLFFSFKNKI